MAPHLLSARELEQLLQRSPKTSVVHVELEDAFANGRLPQSKHCPVFLMSFRDNLKDILSDLEAPVVFYGTADDSHAPAFAAEKAERLGCREVYVFPGGVEAWRAAGLPIEASSESATRHASPPLSGRLSLDGERSEVSWTGRNLASLHRGTVGLNGGWVSLRDGQLVAGELVLDMTRLTCSDLADTNLNAVLLTHLRDHDFFDTEVYPSARVVLTEVGFEASVRPGRPNYRGTAELTLKGITRSLPFELTGGSSKEGEFSLQGSLRFDRTEWNVCYGSARFFPRLGMHLVNDHIDLDLRLNFGRAEAG